MSFFVVEGEHLKGRHFPSFPLYWLFNRDPYNGLL